jgi:hypothetical protein
MVIAVLSAATAGGLYVLSEFFEPDSREISQPVSGVKVRRD